jgi:hypothetical protein
MASSLWFFDSRVKVIWRYHRPAIVAIVSELTYGQ